MPFKKGDKPVKPVAKGNTHAVKHSLHVYRRMLGGKLDGRMSLAKVLREKEQELISALGGDPSSQERTLITDTVNTMLFKGTVENYLMSIDGKIVRDNKVISVVDTWVKLSSHMRGNLQALGLQRRVKTTSLADLLNQPEATSGGNDTTDHAIVRQ